MPTINIHGSGKTNPNANPNTNANTTNFKDMYQAAISGKLKEFVDAQKKNQERDASLTPKIESIASDNIKSILLIAKLRQKSYRDEISTLTKTASWMDQDYNAKARFKAKQTREAEREASWFDQDYNAKARFKAKQTREADRASAALDPYTYRIQNISRIGSMGQRALDRGNWREFAASERELRQMDQRHGSHPQVAAALRVARAQIDAAKEGISPGRLAVGSRFGAMADLASNPMLLEGLGVIGGALGVAWETLKSPLTIANAAQSIVGLSAPYVNTRLSLASMGRRGGMNSKDLQAMLEPTTGGGVPDWMGRLGLDPMSAAQLLQNYGIAPHKAIAGVGDISSIASAQFMPYLGGLGMDRYAGLARQGATLGMFQSGYVSTEDGKGNTTATTNSGMDEYFRRLQKAMMVASREGLDTSQAMDNLQGLMKQAGAGGAVMMGNGQGLTDFWSKMVSSGLPSMRSGEGVMSVMEGANKASQEFGFGGTPVMNSMFASYISRHGGVKSFTSRSGLTKLFGEQAVSDMESRPGGADMLQNIYNAAASGNEGLAITYAKPLFANTPESMQTVFAGSAFNHPGSPDNPLVASRLTGYGLLGQAAHDSNFSDLESAYNLPAGLVGTVYGIESDHGRDLSTSRKGAMGPFQIMPDTWKEYGRGGNVMDTRQAADATGRIWQANLARYGGDLDKATAAWNWGPGNLDKDITAHGADWQKYAPQETQNFIRRVRAGTTPTWQTGAAYDDPNDVTSWNRMNANAGALTYNAGKAVATTAGDALGGSIGDFALKASTFITNLDSSIGHLGSTLDKFTHWMDVKMAGIGTMNAKQVGPLMPWPDMNPRKQ